MHESSLYDDDNTNGKLIKPLRRAYLAEVVIFSVLPAVMVTYLGLTIHGFMRSFTEFSQHFIKIPLYFIMIVSLLMSWRLYSRVYPSLALLNMFFLFGLTVQVGVLYGFYDLSTNTLMSFPWYVYYLPLLPMAVAALFSLLAVFSNCTYSSIFEKLEKRLLPVPIDPHFPMKY